MAKEKNSALVPMSMLSLNSNCRQSKNNKKLLHIFVNLKKTLKWRKHKLQEVDILPRTFRNVNKNSKISFAGVEWYDLYELNTSPQSSASFPGNMSLPFALLFIHQSGWSVTLFIWVLKKEPREGSKDWLKGLL